MRSRSRREILNDLGTAVTGGYVATSLGYAKNETISVGCIGTGSRAQTLMKSLVRIPGVRITAVCDVWDENLAKAKTIADPQAYASKDARLVLERSDVDVVLIGAPNHQHVALLSAACAAGKDVYIEKPLTHKFSERPAALEAQNKHKRIVQVGLQQRSMPHFQKANQIVKSGQIGAVRKVHLTWNRNAASTGDTRYNIDPSSVDWKTWLGSAPSQPFDAYRFRQWRWFWDFGGGVLSDLMVHYIDPVHWFLDLDHPDHAVTIGDRFSYQQWETPDTAQTLLHYGSVQVYFEATFVNARNGAMLEFMGTDATLYLDRGRMAVFPEKKRDEHNQNARLPSVPAMEWVLGDGPPGADHYLQPDAEGLHLSNWLECVRSRQKPAAPVEAALSADAAAHLGNIAYRQNKVARWDEDGERA